VPTVYIENGRVAGLDPRDPIRVSYHRAVGDSPPGRARPDLLSTRPSHGHDLAADPGETRNLASSRPQKTQAMHAVLSRIRSRGAAAP